MPDHLSMQPLDLTYLQATGRLHLSNFDDEIITLGVGYSGFGEGLNNPAMEDVHSVGPIPRGLWQITPAIRHSKLGPYVLPLLPLGNVHGRSSFFIHGDNELVNFTASKGCIVLPPNLRGFISALVSCHLLSRIVVIADAG